jgi:hypothetical protein
MTLIHTSTEEVVIDMLQRTGPCCLDDLVRCLPHLSWGQIYVAVDRMSRHGDLFLHQLGYSTYRVTLSAQLTSSPLYHLTRRRAYDASVPPRERRPIQLQSSSE